MVDSAVCTCCGKEYGKVVIRESDGKCAFCISDDLERGKKNG